MPMMLIILSASAPRGIGLKARSTGLAVVDPGESGGIGRLVTGAPAAAELDAAVGAAAAGVLEVVRAG
jgi:hypothetical protein